MDIGALSPAVPKFPAVVEEIAALIAKHRVVPFLGAGCSARQLGVDWNELARIFVPPDGGGLDPIEAASHYVAREGVPALHRLLEPRLLVGTYDPVLSPVPDLVASMGFGLMYTTNQDRLIELCFAACGQPLNVVVEATHFAIQDPSATTLYKYHGDFSVPASIVFTGEDYQERMTHEATLRNPFEVRLRSDCLSKSLLFLGYSLRDPNVQRLFKQLRATFGDQLPRSYLIQFAADASEASRIHGEYGIHVVDTSELYPDLSPDADRFERLLADLNRCAAAQHESSELQALFEARPAAPHRVVTKRDQEAVRHVLLENESFDAQIRQFRRVYDGHRIPDALQEEAADQFVLLCKNARGEESFGEVKAAFFNFHVGSAEFAFQLMGAAMAVANENNSSVNFGIPLSPPASTHNPVDREHHLLAVAIALHFLAEWKRPITKAMYHAIGYWDPRLPSGLDAPLEQGLRQAFGDVYRAGATTYENPLDRAKRLKNHAGMFHVPTLRETTADLMRAFPQRLKRPTNT